MRIRTTGTSPFFMEADKDSLRKEFYDLSQSSAQTSPSTMTSSAPISALPILSAKFFSTKFSLCKASTKRRFRSLAPSINLSLNACSRSRRALASTSYFFKAMISFDSVSETLDVMASFLAFTLIPNAIWSNSS